MASAVRRLRFPRPEGRPAVIAHGAGNSRDALADAVGAGADYIEVDLWFRNGRFEARHERRLRGLPLLFERWYLRLPPRRPVGLEELFERTTGSVGLFLDLKNGGAPAAELLSRTAEAARPPRLVISSQWWHILRSVGRCLTGAVLLYSVDAEPKLDLALSVAERDPLAAGISCRESLLTPGAVARAHELGLAVVAWTVDAPERAAELASWGVDGITTHRVAELRALFDAGREAKR